MPQVRAFRYFLLFFPRVGPSGPGLRYITRQTARNAHLLQGFLTLFLLAVFVCTTYRTRTKIAVMAGSGDRGNGITALRRQTKTKTEVGIYTRLFTGHDIAQ